MRSPRVGALALVAMLTVAACGSGDGAAGAGDQPADEATQSESATDADAESGADAAATDSVPSPVAQADLGETVLEMSAEIDVVGDALPSFDDPDDDPAVGLTAPVITGQRFDGTDITIGGATGRPTMLVFLAHWCPHCNDEIPEIVTLRDQGDLPADLDIIGISTAVTEDSANYPPSAWIVEKDWTWPVLADTIGADAFLEYGGTGFPFTVMLDADGSVVARKSGNESADKIKAWIEANLSV